MKKRFTSRKLSSPLLKNLQKEFKKDERAERYLEKEKRKLINDKKKVRIKIRKEKEVLKLKQRIKILRGRKK